VDNLIRCIAIDLDDTLLKSDLTVAEADCLAIRRTIAAGVKVLLASGRMARAIRPYAQLLGIDVPLIAYNGALIQTAGSGEVLYHLPVPSRLAALVIPFFQRRGIHLNAYINDQLYMDELTVWGRDYAANSQVEARPVGDLLQILSDGSPHKLLGIGPVARIDAIHAELEGEFGARLELVKSKPYYLEILAPGVSKKNALQELTAGWGLERTEVMAIGDAPNDLTMVEWAGVGVAIGNACDLVKQKADLVVADHDHHGVAEALARLVLA
jgi:Cof subfamily protein (haloacid dehalogenase superfamily)